MAFTAINTIKAGVTLCAAFAISSSAFAQAPVVDANGGSNLEQRIAVLERIVKSRTEMQHRLQTQLDNMQAKLTNCEGLLKLTPTSWKRCLNVSVNCTLK
jgi:TolA-binding protein